MNNLIDGIVYVAPNGNDKLKIYPHGFVKPVTEILESSGELIQEMAQLARLKLGDKATPCEIFEFMGWTKDE